ncbi:MAG: PEP-CTERM sorting domain-containing protein [Proteobacteria bacterium]|nr:PEP-CTERM sorting domain-containing protein [Pseudomonadota bacterium]MBU1058614.1 PEP-CTERM sorting domain-containing protein [Pseudomonadota bacterium]
MKKILVTGLVALALMMGTGSAMALLLTDATTDVGSIDTLLFSTSLKNSGEQTELDWVNDILELSGDEMYLSFIKDTNSADPWTWYATDTAGIFAYELQSVPVHFLIKTGVIKVDGEKTDTHFLYSNEAGTGWAVIDLSELGVTDLTKIAKLSHLDEFGDTTVSQPPPFDSAPVPEPATMLLFGTGLAGLLSSKLRKKNKG